MPQKFRWRKLLCLGLRAAKTRHLALSRAGFNVNGMVTAIAVRSTVLRSIMQVICLATPCMIEHASLLHIRMDTPVGTVQSARQSESS